MGLDQTDDKYASEDGEKSKKKKVGNSERMTKRLGEGGREDEGERTSEERQK